MNHTINETFAKDERTVHQNIAAHFFCQLNPSFVRHEGVISHNDCRPWLTTVSHQELVGESRSLLLALHQKSRRAVAAI
jgi:hypothetical protein